MSDRHTLFERMRDIAKANAARNADLKVGDRVPLPPRKLDVRPNAPLDNRPSFKPARKPKR